MHQVASRRAKVEIYISLRYGGRSDLSGQGLRVFCHPEAVLCLSTHSETARTGNARSMAGSDLSLGFPFPLIGGD